MRTNVLIVGAGPTGLALANTLQREGVDYRLIDRLPVAQNTSRAAVIHAHTLEVLESIGVAQPLVDLGLKLTQFSIRDRDRALTTLNFSRIASQYPFLLMLPQHFTERVLEDRLATQGGHVERHTTATNVEQTEVGVRVAVAGPDGERWIDAKYVVGADGMQSIVRKTAGIEFAGEAYEESFVLADVRMDWPLGRQEVSLFFSPAGLVVVAPLPGGEYRIVATLEDAPEHPDVRHIQSLMDSRGPVHQPSTVTEVTWSSRFRVHHRLANAYRKGGLFLVGDAAHVHSPAGGQGMNCGLVDACVLGRLLADVVKGKRADAALDDYERLRRPAAAQVIALAGRLTGMATMRGAIQRGGRNIALSAVNRLNPVKNKLVQDLSGLARRRLAELPHLAA